MLRACPSKNAPSSWVLVVKLNGYFPEEVYDAFAAVLHVNSTLTYPELAIPNDESEAA